MSEDRGHAEYEEGMRISANAGTPDDLDQAAIHFLRALDLDCEEFNKDWIGWASISEYYYRNGEYDRAVDSCRRLFEFDSQLPPDVKGGALTSLSNIALIDGNIDEAISNAEAALTIGKLSEEYVCQASYIRAKALAMRATNLWKTKNYSQNELDKFIADANSALQNGRSVCGRVRNMGALYEDMYKDIENVQTNLLQFKQATKKGGCFIATAVYGSYSAPEVMVLREFRDNILDKILFGRVFIKAYYLLSPPVADFIAQKKTLKRWVRLMLIEPIVKRLRR